MTEADPVVEPMIKTRDRFILSPIGLVSWLAGGIAAFVSANALARLHS